MPDLQAKRCFRLHQAFARLQPNRQPETFAKPKNAQETVNSPSFPRKRESWLSLCNELFLRKFLNIKQDSRLRGNDGISYFSGCRWGAKVSAWKWAGQIQYSETLRAAPTRAQYQTAWNAAPRPYGLLASRALAKFAFQAALALHQHNIVLLLRVSRFHR